MLEDADASELKRKLEQTKRLAWLAWDPTTAQRLGELNSRGLSEIFQAEGNTFLKTRSASVLMICGNNTAVRWAAMRNFGSEQSGN